MTPRQPLLHDATVVLRAPAQAWSAPDGSMGGAAIHGHYLGDTRLTSSFEVLTDGERPEHIASDSAASDRLSTVSLVRHLDGPGADPDVRLATGRRVTTTGFEETITVESRLDTEVTTEIVVRLRPDLSPMDAVKSGLADTLEPPHVTVDEHSARWSNDTVTATLSTNDALITLHDGVVSVRTAITVPPRGETSITLQLQAEDSAAVVRVPTGDTPWPIPMVRSGDERLQLWVDQALADLDGLRLTTTADPDNEFLAAGAPWFFTLFGRDAIWAARFLLPLGTEVAAGTLRVLAGLQGSERVPDTAEQPGKIMHELRKAELSIPGEGVVLPPLYYGTVDATPLWICLLHDAWRWGMPDEEVAALLPHLEAALAWMRDFGDADGDGLLEYVDETGHGLANQGWKDSGDSVQWRDGTLATGPIALCEVQAYAYEAAMHGAELLEHFGTGDPAAWRAWGGALKARFHESFWIDDADGAYPAIALDADKRPVDSITSNLGHLLGTGLLDERQSRLVAHRLGSPTLDSGYGLRTMDESSAGFWPLSYHGGAVWTHDTAIAIAGLVRDGHSAEARSLIDGLLRTASGFDYRVPELHSGDPAWAVARPIPYPAACRPQAWSAAAAVSVLASILGLEPTEDALAVSPLATAIDVAGLRFRGGDVAITTNDQGEVVAASGGPLEIR